MSSAVLLPRYFHRFPFALHGIRAGAAHVGAHGVEEVGQVHHMDVVPHAGAVPGGIIVAKDADIGPLAVGHLKDQGDQVGFRVMGLADMAPGMGPAGVEIPQGYEFEPIGPGAPAHHPLHGQLGGPIGVGGLRGVAFQDGDVPGFPIGGRGGGEYDLLHIVLDHGGEQHPGAVQVVVVILEGVFHAFPHLGVGGEMDHRIDGLLFKNAVQKGFVPNTHLI